MASAKQPAYRGRFAPSPTGPLHFGSLVAAVGSYLDARAHGGEWLLRIEDIDTPRNSPGATECILRQLEDYGFTWDGETRYQNNRLHRYETLLDDLRQRDLAYGCACTRREIANVAVPKENGERPYPGTCRNGLPPHVAPRAWRARVEDTPIRFTDRIQGELTQKLPRVCGDFVLRRGDGLYAYQLAVVADDAEQGITHVVRGADLIDSTPRQIWLYRQFGLHPPVHAHLPVAVNAAGEKLSKQTSAAPITRKDATTQLVSTLQFLGQPAPASLKQATLAEIWQWAKANWRFNRIPCRRKLEPVLFSGHA